MYTFAIIIFCQPLNELGCETNVNYVKATNSSFQQTSFRLVLGKHFIPENPVTYSDQYVKKYTS